MSNYPDLSAVRRVLVVRMRHLGDVLLTSPVFTQLKKVLPTAEIDVFINQESLPMLEGHPAISRYFLYDRRKKVLGFFKKIAYEVSLLLAVRRAKYDLVLNLTEGDRGALIALFSGARLRVGFDPGKSGFLGKRKIYTHLAKICPHPRHTVERQLDVLRRIGIFPEEAERDLVFHIPQKSFEGSGLEKGSFVLIHPVSRWLFKSPPPHFFVELIRALQQRGEHIVLSGGTDREGLALIEAICREVPEVSNRAGQTDLKGLGALISLSSLLITVDSVPLHMASALKTPVVALFGPSSEVNWGPWMHPQARVVAANVSCRPCYMDGCGGSKRSDCLEKITVDQVLGAVYSLKSSPKYEARASLLCKS